MTSSASAVASGSPAGAGESAAAPAWTLSIPSHRTLAAALALSANVLLLWTFYDQHWYPADEGIYAHMAERLLAGEVLNRDVQSLHPGYITFLNAAAFALFGLDLVSLRYPLVLATFVQAALVWILFVRRDALVGAVASVGLTAFGVLQFLNPSAHWYALFLTVVLICWLTWIPPARHARIFVAGVLLGTIALFRHLTGVWVAMGLLVILLHEQSTGARGREALLGRALAALMLIALAAYLHLTGDAELSGIGLIATWPAAILLMTARRVGTPNRAVLTLVLTLSAGAVAAATPLVMYHVAHGSLTQWIQDVTMVSAGAAERPLSYGAWFGVLPIAGAIQLLSASPAAMVNGLYWILLPLVPAMNGMLLLRWMRARPDGAILPVMAAFYGLVTLHLAGAVYLSFSVGLTVAGVLWLLTAANDRTVTTRYVATAATAAMIAVAVWFHAAQSSHRTIGELSRGHRSVAAAVPRCAPFARSSLRIESAECREHERLVAVIEHETPVGGTIFALPSDAELYFLTGRRNPFRFYSSAIGVRSAPELAAVLDELTNRPPHVVAFRPDDKYNTDSSRTIMAFVRDTYEHFDTIGGVELYRRRMEAY